MNAFLQRSSLGVSAFCRAIQRLPVVNIKTEIPFSDKVGEANAKEVFVSVKYSLFPGAGPIFVVGLPANTLPVCRQRSPVYFNYSGFGHN